MLYSMQLSNVSISKNVVKYSLIYMVAGNRNKREKYHAIIYGAIYQLPKKLSEISIPNG